MPLKLDCLSVASYHGGTKTTVELVADRNTRRLIGGTVIGSDGAR